MNLNPRQKERAVQLLEIIVRPGDNEFGDAVEEAQKLFGYWQPTTIRKRGRPGRRALSKRKQTHENVR